MATDSGLRRGEPDAPARSTKARVRSGHVPGLGDAVYRYGLIGVWAVIIAVFSALRPETFATVGNAQTIAGSQAVLAVLALGLLLPLVAGEFDLSISGVACAGLVLTGWLNVVHGWPIVLVALVVVAAGAAVGALNGFLAVVVGVDSIIVTLGTGTVLVGAAIGLNNVTTPGISDALVSAVRSQVLGVPLGFAYAVLVCVVVWYCLVQTPLGRYIYFVGAGREVARLSGIRVEAIRFGTFVACGAISSLAALMLAGWLGAADPNVGQSFLLPAYAAAFLGAGVLTPGRFNAWGTLIAVFFLATGITGLTLLGLSGWVDQVFYGASLVVALSVSRIAARRRGL